MLFFLPPNHFTKLRQLGFCIFGFNLTKDMKNILTLIIALTATSIVFAQNTAALSGKITNPTGEKVTLRKVITEDGKRKEIVLDSAKLSADGTFKMQTEVDEITEVLFYDASERCPLLLQKGDDVYLTLNTKMFDETIVYSGKGAAKNNAIKNLSLMNEVAMNKIYAFDEAADTSEIYTYMDKSFDAIADVIKDYQTEIPDFKTYGDSQLESLKQNKSYIKKNIAKDRAFKVLVASLKGSNGIDIKGINLKGKDANLSQYKGKTIVIDFWATWCAPCKAEMPAFKELEKKYGTAINFVSLGIYCKEENWKEMATDLGFENNIFINKEGEAQIKAWAVNFIPRYVVLDKDFKIVDALAPRPSSGDLEALLLKMNPELK